MKTLQIQNLQTGIENKEILKGVNLELEKGKIYVLMGPNGSGKSTLANVLAGNPKFEISGGKIIFNGVDITEMKVDERARKGIFLSFQYPVEVSGVTISNFLRKAYNSIHEDKLSIFEFKKLLEEKAELLGMNKEFLSRYLNEGFSGGEKKKAEILQLLVLNPKFVVLDETDSGLDIDALRVISQGINKFKGKDKTILIITHYKRILEYINPDKVFVMKMGIIVKEGGKDLIDELESKGYEDVE